MDRTPDRVRARRFLLTLVIGGLDNAPLMAARFIMPVIAAAGGASPVFLGILAGLFSAAPIAINVSFGRWVDRVGTIAPMLVASSMVTLGATIALVWPSNGALLPAAALIGSGAIFAHVAATRAVSDASTELTRTRNFGLMIAAYSVFQFLGPLVAGTAYEHLGRGWALTSVAAFGFAAILLLISPGHAFARQSSQAPLTQSKPRILQLFAQPLLIRWLVVGAVMSAVSTIYPLVVALHSLHTGLSASQAGAALGAFALGAVVSRALTGAIRRITTPRTALCAMLAFGSVAYAVLPFVTGFFPFTALSALLGFIVGMAAPFVISKLYEEAPLNRTNEVMGLSMAITNLLQTVLPLALGLAASGLGYGVIAWILSALMLATIALAIRG